jgi:hypothetical protein
VASIKVIDRRIEEFREVSGGDVIIIIGGINWSINAELCLGGSVSNLTMEYILMKETTLKFTFE